MWGFLIHEAAHIRFTAFDCMKSDAVADKIGCPRKIFHKIWNMFEDAFIERKVLELFPGAIGDLTEARRHLVATGNYPLFTAEVEFPELVIRYGFYRAMVCSTNQRVHRPNMDNARAILAQAVDPSDLALLDAIIDRSVDAECSMDNIEIARDLFLWLKDHYSEPAQADEEGGSQEQDQEQEATPRKQLLRPKDLKTPKTKAALPRPKGLTPTVRMTSPLRARHAALATDLKAVKAKLPAALRRPERGAARVPKVRQRL